MKLYKITITPTTNFATTLKGDTLFGQICWAIRYSFGTERLKELLHDYETSPFLIVSDGFASGYLPKPTMPSRYLKEDPQEKKRNRKKIWLTIDEILDAKYEKARSSEEIDSVVVSGVVLRNSINYKTSTTGADGFDPYSENEMSLGVQDIYCLVDDAFSFDEMRESLKFVADMGYGKDSSIGKGRFEISDIEALNIKSDTTTFMSLSPFVPQGLEYKNIFYEPFTRFGKTGAGRVNKNPFKAPIILANSGAVIEFEDKKDMRYIGKCIKNISTYKDVVHQGYSIVLPMRSLEEKA
jgi:CRISPR-associated protein Csm4